MCDYLRMSARMGGAQAEGAEGIQDSMASLRAQVEGDRAFERLYRKHVTDVYRYALALVRSEADAEDVTQTTFLNAFRAYQRGERPRKSKSWLLAIAHNVCRQRFRHQARRPQEVAFNEDVAEVVVPEEGPTADDLVRALQQLSFNQRAALVMRELEGRPYSEIGEILELPVSAVETLLFRARRALREQLENAITCGEAEQLLSLQLDGRLLRTHRSALRAHLRSCSDCARAARSQRAQRSAWKSLAVIPLPGSLTSLLGGGGTAAVGMGTGVAVKVAAPRPQARPTAPSTAANLRSGPVARTVRPEVKAKVKAKPATGHRKRGVGRGHGSVGEAQTSMRGREGQTRGSHGHSARHSAPRANPAPPGRAKQTTVTRSVGHRGATVRTRTKKKGKARAKVETRTKKVKHSTSHRPTGGTGSNGQDSPRGRQKAPSSEQAAPAPTHPTGNSTSPDHLSKH
jgi:RNA polymerase sigma-70 factor (ECF subfamily)